MQDTFIPLDIAYLDANARIIDIQQMEPETTRLHTSSGPRSQSGPRRRSCSGPSGGATRV